MHFRCISTIENEASSLNLSQAKKKNSNYSLFLEKKPDLKNMIKSTF